ncbi:hypothetical protein CBL_08052 [Carabus blaptoides fortunei]
MMTMNNSLPPWICITCKKQLRRAYKFQKKCNKSLKTFIHYLSLLKCENDENAAQQILNVQIPDILYKNDDGKKKISEDDKIENFSDNSSAENSTGAIIDDIYSKQTADITHYRIKMIGFNHVILLAIVAYSCKAAVLPTYLDKCCMDNYINDCIKNTANRVLKTFALGDNYYNVYRNFTVTNIRVYGFPLAYVTSVNLNLSAGTFNAQYTLEKLTVECDYDIWLNNTCVAGFGRAQIIMRNITLDQSYPVQIDNEGYPRVRNPTASYHIQNTQYSMSNMDAAANAYMNMNADALGVLFKSQVSEAFSDVLSLPYIAVFDKIKISDDARYW